MAHIVPILPSPELRKRRQEYGILSRDYGWAIESSGESMDCRAFVWIFQRSWVSFRHFLGPLPRP